MFLEDFQTKIVEILKEAKAWNQVVSVDLETKILDQKDFLTNERILAVGVSWRTPNGVECRTIVLDEDSDEAEFRLLENVGRIFMEVRPLVMVGYNICGYDFPLLNIKMKKYDDWLRQNTPVDSSTGKQIYPKEYWALKDALTRSYVLDIMHVSRFRIARHDNAPPKYLKLKDVLEHEIFSHLALKKKKHLAEGDAQQNKGEKVFSLWQNKDPALVEYLEADVHDTLLIAEEIFKALSG